MHCACTATSPTGHCTTRRTSSGLLLLQDFPLQWGHARSVRQQAVEQARAAVDALGHHPSIAMWTAHDDPSATDAGVTAPGWQGAARTLAAKQLPSWNKSVLDRWVKRAFEHGGLEPSGRGPLGRRARISPSSTAPTATSGSDGATVKQRIWPSSLLACRAWCVSSASSGPTHHRSTHRSSTSNSRRTTGRVSTGTGSRRRPAIERAVTERSFPPTDFDDFSRVARRLAVLPSARAQGADRDAAPAASIARPAVSASRR